MASPFSPVDKHMSDLPRHVHQELILSFKRINLKKGEHLLQIGQVARNMYLVHAGAVRQEVRLES